MISDSKFYMWRALFALAHADLVITQEERIFMKGAIEALDLSDHQRAIMEQDIAQSQDALEMFRGITDKDDQKEFFHIAYELAWIDGDQSIDEEKVIARLKREHEAQFPETSEAQEEEMEISFEPAEKPRDEGLQRLIDTLKKNREESD